MCYISMRPVFHLTEYILFWYVCCVIVANEFEKVFETVKLLPGFLVHQFQKRSTTAPLHVET